MADLEDLISQTKAKVGALIAKPKMSDKLLNKPPFRFLHDTISAIITTTGFGEGLYTEAEMDSAQIAEKQAKIIYLEKMFNLVGICKGAALQVKAAKVVSGLEAENTNEFLIALAECASDSSIDSPAAVERCLGGEQPGSQPPPLRSNGGALPSAESKNDYASSNAQSDFGSKGLPEQREMDFKSASSDAGAKSGPPPQMEAKLPIDMDQIAPERGKSRGGTRGGKPNQATSDVGLGAAVSNINLDTEIERCDGSEAATQELLGSLISRPRLTEKLLGKPPFRFLHDIVMEVIRSTGFANGLYDESECDSANIGDKNLKMTFLEKIVKVVGAQLNTLVEAKPAKIVAGRDPQDTNNFLQLLAVAARHKPDSQRAVQLVLEEMGDPRAATMGGGGGGRGASYESAPAAAVAAAVDEGGGSNSRARVDDERVSSSRQPMPEPKEPISSREIMDNDDGGGDDEKRSARPTTARRRPPKVKEGAKEVQAKDVAPAEKKKAAGIIIDGAQDDDEDDDVNADIPDETQRLAEQMHADAKSSGGADVTDMGDPQSKLVKDIMSRQVEQEAAGRTAQEKESTEESKSSPNENVNTNNNTGIRLGRLRKTGIDKKGGAAAAGGAAGTATFGESELEKLRKSIQLLVQQTGPLGTCMDYIQEDISMMTAELFKWEEECRKYEIEYEEAKRKTKDVLHPLKLELADLEDQIFEQAAKVSSAKAANARNEDKIQQILKLSATA